MSQCIYKNQNKNEKEQGADAEAGKNLAGDLAGRPCSLAPAEVLAFHEGENGAKIVRGAVGVAQRLRVHCDHRRVAEVLPVCGFESVISLGKQK